jgi:hypothetical protein
MVMPSCALESLRREIDDCIVHPGSPNLLMNYSAYTHLLASDWTTELNLQIGAFLWSLGHSQTLTASVYAKRDDESRSLLVGQCGNNRCEPNNSERPSNPFDRNW